MITKAEELTQVNGVSIKFAVRNDLTDLKAIANAHRHELGFVTKAVFEEAIDNKEILYIPHKGFLHFHHRRDRISTLYHLCVSPKWRNQGIGRYLVLAWEDLTRSEIMMKWRDYHEDPKVPLLRLKCPIDLDANGFYASVGFKRVGIEEGKNRRLIIWEKRLTSELPQKPKFIASLSMGGGDLKRLRDWWDKGDDFRNPFKYVIYSPISCPESTTKYLRQRKEDSSISEAQRTKEVWLDCGAYQVQQGKFSYNQLLDFLKNFYTQNQWVDGYVLPDIVPVSNDSDAVVEYKVQETIFQCRRFYQQLPEYVQQRAVAPVHGRYIDQIAQCIESYAEIGIQRLGFGSWGTCGPSDSVNMLSSQSLETFKSLYLLAQEHGMTVHVFGIGGPNSLKRLRNNQTVPHSLDSTTWWKAAGYGGIFFPHRSQMQITVRRGVNATKQGFEKLKLETGHECKFCKNIEDLRQSRDHRIMHNLSAWLDTLEKPYG